MLGESEDKVEKLWANVEYLNNGFRQLGFDIGHSETPIIPVRVRPARQHDAVWYVPCERLGLVLQVMLGDEELAKAFSARLFEEGVFAGDLLSDGAP